MGTKTGLYKARLVRCLDEIATLKTVKPTDPAFTRWWQSARNTLESGLGAEHPLYMTFHKIDFRPIDFYGDAAPEHDPNVYSAGLVHAERVLRDAIEELDWADTSVEAREPSRVVYNITGANARVNVNSRDSSTNVVNTGPDELFRILLTRVEAIQDHVQQERVRGAVEAMQRSQGSAGFTESYQQFMSVIADHLQVYGPFLPALAQLLAR